MNEMAQLGYHEGENIEYDLHFTNFEPEKERKIIQKFIDDKVDLIVTFPTEVSMLAKQMTEKTGIPFVFCFANIEETGLVESVSHPGGNVTGVRYPSPDLAIKRFEIMHELVPNMKKIVVPYQRGYPIVKIQMDALRPAAEAVGVTVEELPADNAEELQKFYAKREKQKNIDIDAILNIAETLGVTPAAFEANARFAYKHNIPLGGAYIEVGDYKPVFGVNVNMPMCGADAANLVNKIFNGAVPGSTPVVSTESYFEINYTVAKKFGLRMSEGLLSLAQKVYR